MRLIRLFIIFLSLSSCRSISFEEFRPAMSNPMLLPPLYVVVDTLSFETFYWNDPSAHAYQQQSNFSLYSNRYVHDVRVQDAITLFQRDIKDNITDPRGEVYGYATCKIVAGECRFNTVIAIISLATLFLPNFAGLPFNHHMTHLELEVEIYDAREQLAGRYVQDGFGKVPIALWRGYNTFDACRLSNMTAFKHAMQKIKKSISEDYEQIHQQLYAAGPLVKR